MGHLGNDAAVTPHLDRFAKEDAVSFNNAYCQNPVCTPSRCSFMSGWYTHVRGHRTMYHMMHEDESVLLKTLKDAGYTVYWGGKNDLIPGDADPSPYCDIRYTSSLQETEPIWDIFNIAERRGDPEDDNFFSFYFGKLDKGDEDVYYDIDWDVIHNAIDFIKSKPQEPFCIFLAINYPHAPFAVEEPWFSMIDRDGLPPRIPAPDDWQGKPALLEALHEKMRLGNWTEERWNELRAVYYGMCARVDHQFGMVIDALKAAGVYDDTAVFAFSDHGEFAGDYDLVEKTQNTFEDALVRVPLLVKPQRGVAVKPRVTDALVELIDFTATVEALTGVSLEEDHFGLSLLPVLAGETENHRDAVFCEGGRLRGEEQATEKQSGVWENPAHIYYPRSSLQATDEHDYHTKAVMCRTDRYKYVYRLYEQDELYDLQTDPHELDNRIDDAEFAGVLAAMTRRMLDFFVETGDIVPRKTDSRGISL